MKRAGSLIAMLLLSGCPPVHLRPAVDSQKSSSYRYKGFFRNKVVYYSTQFASTEVEGADVSSFEVLGPLYAKDRQRAYFTWKPIPDAAVESFVGLFPAAASERVAYPQSAAYAVDRRRVYHNGRVIALADPASFELIPVPAPSEPFREYAYAKDENAVYKSDQRIAGADPRTFQLLTFAWAKDRNHVFYSGLVVEGANPATFRWFERDPYPQDRRYATDGTAVYHGTRRVEGADPESFEFLGNAQGFFTGYTRDRHHVFREDEVIAGADPGSFRQVDRGWFRDRDHAFVEEKLVEGADPESLQILPGDYAIDSRRAYHVYLEKASPEASPPRPRRRWRVRAREVDTASFQTLSFCGYAKDRDHVYFELEIVPEADPTTFQVQEKVCWRGADAVHSYVRGEML